MPIVIPGALPDYAAAPELARLLPEYAPTLAHWLSLAPAATRAWDVSTQGCTAFEAWQLEMAGFRPEAGQNLSAGLGPLLAGTNIHDDDPVWLGELAHLALGTDSAHLLDPALMDIQPEESAALLAVVEPIFATSDVKIEPLLPNRWRLRLPANLSPVSASPLAVTSGALRQWWSIDAQSRPWRRLLNEIQMAWHEHPVNEARSARGVAPVNTLWLYGGARPFQQNTISVDVHPELDHAQRTGDWAQWLIAIEALDRSSLAPLANGNGRPIRPLELLLLGTARSARLFLNPRVGLLKWLPTRKHDWNTWWSHPV